MDPEKKRGIPGTILYIILRVVLAFAVVAVIAGVSNFFHSNSKFLQARDAVNLNEIIASGEEFPEGEFVTLQVYYPIGNYAESKSSLTVGSDSNGGGFTSGVDQYYMILLEDSTLMSLKISNTEDIKALDELNTLLGETDDWASLPDYVEVTGKLTTLTDPEIVSFYEEALGYLDLTTSDSNVRMYLLDATEIPGSNMLLFAGIIVGVILLIILAVTLISRKKKKAAQASNVLPPYPDGAAGISGYAGNPMGPDYGPSSVSDYGNPVPPAGSTPAPSAGPAPDEPAAQDQPQAGSSVLKEPEAPENYSDNYFTADTFMDSTDSYFTEPAPEKPEDPSGFWD